MSETKKTVLGPDCRISGELALDNDAVIMGQFSGTLRVSGMLEVTDSAEISGTLIVGTLRLAGKAEADVVAEDGVELLPGSQLVGQLYTSRLNIVDGAVFQGDVCVGPKAVQAAGEMLKQDVTLRAQPQEEDETDASFQPDMMAQEEEMVDIAPAPQAPAATVRTNAASLNAVLQRRPKVLSARAPQK